MTATTIRVQMAQRKDTAANWTAANPILLLGEIGYETDTKKFKIGDGATNWNSLAYLPIPDGSGNLTITGNLEIGSTGTLTFEGSTADGFETTLAVTDPTADRTITLPDVTGTVITSGDTGSVTSTMLADGTIVNADINASAEIAVSKLANGTANQVLVTDGTDVSWSDNLTLAGDLTVNGTTTTINTQDLLVEDKNIVIGNVNTPTDVTADGGGITLKGSTDKTINWVDATDAWTLSENVNIASGKEYRINGTKVLDATSLGSAIVSSSLTSVGTIGTGVWQGTAIDAAYLDSTIVTTGDTGTITSTMIADGTIIDGDVNASAAIAGTKISPDFGSQNVTTTGTATAAALIPSGSSVPTNGVYLPSSNNVAISTNGAGRVFFDSSGRLLVGTGSSRAVAALGPYLQIEGTSGSQGALSVVRNSNSASAGNIIFGKSRGTVNGDSTIVQSGDILGEIRFAGADGVDLNSRAAAIYCFVDGTPGVADMPGRLSFYTTPSGSSSPTERLRITSDGKLGLGTSSPTELLDVRGIAHFQTGTNRYIKLDSGSNTTYDSRIDASHSLTFRSFIAGGGTPPSMVFDSSGRLGLGNSSPARSLDVSSAEQIVGHFKSSSTVIGRIGFSDANTTNDAQVGVGATGDNLILLTSGVEHARLDSSGRLLVGTSSAFSVTSVSPLLQIKESNANASVSIQRTSNDASPPLVLLSKSRGTDTSIVSDNDILGSIRFIASDGVDVNTVAARIQAEVDGTPGANDMPGRLVFSTTAGGTSNVTERLRITSAGVLQIADAGDITVGTTTGTKIGTATSQKIGFYNTTPVVQPTTGVAEATFVENSGGTAVNVDSTFGGYTIQQVVQALQNLGLLA